MTSSSARESRRGRRSIATKISPRVESALQRVALAGAGFAGAGLSNHAAAGAYAFLLSATPAVLLIAVALGPFLPDTAAALGRIVSWMKGLASADAIESAARTIAGRETGFFAGIFALANLLWTARVFVTSLRKGLRAVTGAKEGALRSNVFAFALEIGALVLVMAVMALSEVVLAMANYLENWRAMAPLTSVLARAALGGVPLLCVFAFVHLSYRSAGISKGAGLHALGCVAAYAAFQYVSRSVVNAARYDVLYGVLGGIVLVLINVYVFFLLLYFFASLACVHERFDVLLLARFHARTARSDRTSDRMSRWLFSRPDALFRRYSRRFAAGETVFSHADREKTVYYLIEGRVSIVIPSAGEAKRVRVRRGEFFGEMSLLLDEPRLGDAVADSACVALAIPPPVFRKYVESDPAASRRLVSTLVARLKDAHGGGAE